MSVSDYEYLLEQCDVPEARRRALEEFRGFRRKCLEYLNGDSATSVANQVYSLTWQTVVFRTLNEARRLEPRRRVNGAFWELTSIGYAHIMALGIRKLIDKDKRADSLWNVIAQLERRPELLRREFLVCYDGLPYDHAAASERWRSTLDMSTGVHVRWSPTRGPEAWSSSERLHATFDALAGYPKKRRRADLPQRSVIAYLKNQLASPPVTKVATSADRMFAHAERIAAGSEELHMPTYENIDEALRSLVRVANFISSTIFNDGAFGDVVPTPQFDALDGLQRPWVTRKNLPALELHWESLTGTINRWAYDTNQDFLPANPADAPPGLQ